MQQINGNFENVDQINGNLSEVEQINGSIESVEQISGNLSEMEQLNAEVVASRIYPAPTKLSRLEDTNIVNPTENQVLKYDGQKWVNGESGSGVNSYEDLSDKPSINGRILVGNKSSEDLGIVVPEFLGDLGDTNFLGVTEGEVLTYKNGYWRNEPAQGSDIVDNLTSTDTDKALSANQGRVLKGLVDGKGTYSKPSGGIPKTDLASAVQTTLDSVSSKANASDVYTKAQTDSKISSDISTFNTNTVQPINSALSDLEDDVDEINNRLSDFDNLYDNGLLSDNFWNGANLSLSADGMYISNGKLPKGTYKISCDNSVSGAYILYGLNSSGTWEIILNGEAYSTLNNGKSFTITKDYSKLRIYTNVSISGLNIQINSGTKKLPYTPYAMSNSAITDELSTITIYDSNNIAIEKCGNAIHVFSKELVARANLVGINVVPIGYRPRMAIRKSATIFNGSKYVLGSARIDTSGLLDVWNEDGSKNPSYTSVLFDFVYFI